MNLEDFDYFLPEDLIAQEPVECRDSSRLLVLHRDSGEIEHRIFRECVELFKAGDVLVVNSTRVIPARLMGIKKDTGAVIEVLLLTRQNYDTWEALVKPGRRVQPGTVIVFGDGLLTAEALGITESGGRLLKFSFSGIFENLLELLGQMPLPPYIKKRLADNERYQTVYAKTVGSAAAPTAGLHFTPALLSLIKSRGIEIAEVMLHVGLGTFRPVKTSDVTKHKMHSEYYEITQEAADIVNKAKNTGGRLIAVGTTTARTIETVADAQGHLRAGQGWTDIFIYPGYKFKSVDSLITNFHLPKSTLLMLVSALAGRDKVMNAYRVAVREQYRFFSFGDAMLIL